MPRVVHINISDKGGGAENVAWVLMHKCEAEGSMIVHLKKSESEKVFEFEKSLIDLIVNKVNGLLMRLGIRAGIRQLFGITEKYNQTIQKLSKLEAYQRADIVHLHNIHGGYFDIAALKWICQNKKVVWTLHDMWSFTGGEAHTFGDRSFEKGGVLMPQSSIYPIGKTFSDNRKNWMSFKRNLYASTKNQITFVPVCDWLADGLLKSSVWPRDGQFHVIYNGVDTNIFHNEGNRNWLIPRVLLFNSDNPYKGSAQAVEVLKTMNNRIELVSVGKSTGLINEIRNEVSINSSTKMNTLLNNVDILLFPSKAESFPLLVLEAMASGVCVVSSDVGGVGEVLGEETGMLYKSDDTAEMKIKLEQCVNDLARTREMGSNASSKVAQGFDQALMIAKYSALYQRLALEANS